MTICKLCGFGNITSTDLRTKCGLGTHRGWDLSLDRLVTRFNQLEILQSVDSNYRNSIYEEFLQLKQILSDTSDTF